MPLESAPAQIPTMLDSIEAEEAAIADEHAGVPVEPNSPASQVSPSPPGLDPAAEEKKAADEAVAAAKKAADDAAAKAADDAAAAAKKAADDAAAQKAAEEYQRIVAELAGLRHEVAELAELRHENARLKAADVMFKSTFSAANHQPEQHPEQAQPEQHPISTLKEKDEESPSTGLRHRRSRTENGLH